MFFFSLLRRIKVILFTCECFWCLFFFSYFLYKFMFLRKFSRDTQLKKIPMILKQQQQKKSIINFFHFCSPIESYLSIPSDSIPFWSFSIFLRNSSRFFFFFNHNFSINLNPKIHGIEFTENEMRTNHCYSFYFSSFSFLFSEFKKEVSVLHRYRYLFTWILLCCYCELYVSLLCTLTILFYIVAPWCFLSQRK